MSQEAMDNYALTIAKLNEDGVVDIYGLGSAQVVAGRWPDEGVILTFDNNRISFSRLPKYETEESNAG